MSKLECLPNEILIEIFEKYFNGLDIFCKYFNKFNQRFNWIFLQCRKLNMNLIDSRSDEFRYCVDHLLTTYENRITRLVLSDCETPGQVKLFLQKFPSFQRFQQLNSLYIHCTDPTIDSNQFQNAIFSLTNTNVRKLTVKIASKTRFSSNETFISGIFSIKSLKSLSLSFDGENPHLNLSFSTQLNLEHLILIGIECLSPTFNSLYRHSPRLRTLHISVIALPVQLNTISLQFEPLLQLESLVLHINYQFYIDDLSLYLSNFPSLKSLQINGPIELISSNSWQQLFNHYLPNLKYFTYKTNLSRLKFYQTFNAEGVDAFSDLKNDFHVIFGKHESHGFHKRIKERLRRREDHVHYFDESHRSLLQWWCIPTDQIDKTVSHLSLSNQTSLFSSKIYFDNVKVLEIFNLNADLISWITKSINCSRVDELTVSLCDEQPSILNSLLKMMTNVRLLDINYDYLSEISEETCPHLKCLDISDEIHRFHEEDLIRIARLFPTLEHLLINTNDLFNVPLINEHFHHLRTLTFRIPEKYFHRLADFKEDSQIPFLYQIELNWIKIWIDQSTFDKSFWQNFSFKN
ncbi:unnamed protein product [Adineta ricciae]|uniref:F-box domain-containing protein n=1 Tax=Adineta ricciae TaxID=249248 RepID=A0A815J5N6_ADIRI|nr:unnamed protein product [Adineta ricciae]CAF1505692.1 unnamed protein product [Adineta ricciae]